MPHSGATKTCTVKGKGKRMIGQHLDRTAIDVLMPLNQAKWPARKQLEKSKDHRQIAAGIHASEIWAILTKELRYSRGS